MQVMTHGLRCDCPKRLLSYLITSYLGSHVKLCKDCGAMEGQRQVKSFGEG